MSLLRLDASIRREGSASGALADIVERQWQHASPDVPVKRRHIGLKPLPSEAWPMAVSAYGTPQPNRTPDQQAAVDLARAVVDELAAAEAYLFAVPLYNFGVSQHFKTYVDLATTDPRMASPGAPATAGKPGILVTVQGGNYSPGTPKEGWDHATAWMRRILEEVWQIELEVITREFTLVGTNPALDAFTDMSDQIRSSAERRAYEYGRKLAARGRAAA